MNKISVSVWNELQDRVPAYALVADVDLVVVRFDENVSVLYGRCAHRGALMSDGRVQGDNLICGVHGWDYRLDTGVSEYNNSETLSKFDAWIEDGQVWVDEDAIRAWAILHPQPYDRDSYQGLYQDHTGTGDEPYVKSIRSLASDGLSKVGHHGPAAAMGVPRDTLPKWDDLQFVVAQLHKLPLLDEEPVGTHMVIGPRANKPLALKIPLFVSDMSFGALSEEAKVALAKGAELAGTGICSGEGGMLPEEQAANCRYFYELASARFGFSWDKVQLTQAFHFKGGQGAKTGTGGHLPGSKVTGKIAQVRSLAEGEAAISPARFPDWTELGQYRDFPAQVR
jgi:nitrite reductase/ring-hydroxylating ferredoxin subunit